MERRENDFYFFQDNESETETETENPIEILIQLDDLIRSRREFENRIYDFLVSPLYILPDESFWEPVHVSLTQEQIDSLPEIQIENHECNICKETLFIFNKLVCCNQVMCIGCSDEWFNRSVYCPYCKQDLREKI
jgi:hypothetical protein